MSGALAGIRIVEMAGIGPGPFAAMMLADHGADVIRICRPGTPWDATDILLRSRKSIVLDVKKSAAIEVARRLIGSADGLIEGYRPGVMERLGLGPDELLARYPRLVYGRMTGWGQEGSYSRTAGHDINYLALSGALHTFGRAGERPTPPVNTVGDFGGGGMLLAFGMVSALLHAGTIGKGQVIDCAMTDGASLLMSMIWGFRAAGTWSDVRGTNLLDTGAHFYDVYETSDGKFISIGAIEPQFYAQLRARLGLDDPDFDAQNDQSQWPLLKDKLTAVFKMRTRDEWCALLEGSDTCFAPVLSMAEAPDHPHNAHRRAFLTVGGVRQPAPAPRFSATPAVAPNAPVPPAQTTRAVLQELGYTDVEISRFQSDGTVYL
jgi:alpha-methylacyl-CoA racemase